MQFSYLKFEKPIADLQEKINELKSLGTTAEIDITEEVTKLEEKSRQLTRSIFSNLSTAQVLQMARHPLRPYILDYIPHIFTDFDELHGDRHCSDGPSIVAGLARLDNMPVMIMGHQKGRKTAEKVKRNFGMPRPEDYRKTLRLMEMAERYQLPIITLIDTAGAYPGVGAEERNQSEAIAQNLFKLSALKTPVICIVTGEGGSGGALALGVGDRVAMLQYGIYSVITPEGCASILWKTPDKAPEAAEVLGITAEKNKSLGLIDDILEEPLGGAHRDVETMSSTIKQYILSSLKELTPLSADELVKQRYERLMQYGLNQ